MQSALPVDLSAPTRQLLRMLRTQHQWNEESEGPLPESVMWQCYMELRKRGDERGELLFMRSIKQLHRRRAIGVVELPCEDHHPEEHRLVEDPMLSELWKAYKRCICAQRTGPAAQLLRDIEAQLVEH